MTLADPGTTGDIGAACALCAARLDAKSGVDRAGGAPLGWCRDVIETSEGHRTRWICADCTRRFVRSIETKLDQEWW